MNRYEDAEMIPVTMLGPWMAGPAFGTALVRGLRDGFVHAPRVPELDGGR